MQITDIKPYPVWVGSRNQLVVKVETDEGIYGLGIEMDEKAAQGHSWRFWEAPHFPRSDGSVTNS